MGALDDYKTLIAYPPGFDVSDIPVPPMTDLVVNQKSDLPDPVGGVISIPASTRVIFADNIDFGTDRLQLATDTILSGTILHTLSSDTTGNFVTGVNTQFFRSDLLRYSVPNGTVFDFEDTAGGVSDIQFNDTAILASTTTARIDGVAAFLTDRFGISGDSGPVVLEGFIVAWVSFRSRYGSDNLINSIDITNAVILLPRLVLSVFIGPPGQTGIAGLIDSANVPAGNLGIMQGLDFLGGVTPLNGIDPNDLRWEITSSPPIVDSSKLGFVHFEGNITATDITAQNVAVPIVGTYITEFDNRFETTADGKIIYRGDRDICVSVTLFTSATVVTSNHTCSVSIGLGNTDTQPTAVRIDATRQPGQLNNSNPVALNTTWTLVISKNDFLQPLYENNTSPSVDIIAESVKFRVVE